MSELTILRFPDPRLKTIAAPVTHFDAKLRKLAKNMAKIMYQAPGVGLAATQVDIHLRLIVVDVSITHDALLVIINPEILEHSGTQYVDEGCLSVPGIYEKMERFARVVVRYVDLDGAPQTIAAEGLLAVCLQHEMEHLDGHIFVEHLSALKQKRIKTKMLKQAKFME